jgi:tRNA uridine 5-carboxymethylaminomethyl modification enzyme
MMPDYNDYCNFDIIVVGGGHAGVEAALSGARIGLKTLLITINLDTIALMPCNPSIGGPGKGHIVREIDALGGQMARTIDQSYIHIRTLNTSKGPAVRALRAQADKYTYQKIMKHVLENQENLFIRQGMVKKLLYEESSHSVITKYALSLDDFSPKSPNLSVRGVEIETGERFFARSVIITTGTFLNGTIHIGDTSYAAGRLGEFAATGLTDSLLEAGCNIRRLKTGTVARVDSRSLDFDQCVLQDPSPEPLNFSYFTDKQFALKQVPCWITYTNSSTHDVIRNNFHRSPLFGGKIKGVGPRYCPSIEDKVKKFSDRDRHPVFIEPEGNATTEIYLQGMSTSLPMDVQISMLRTIPGLQNVNIMRPGYAVEYDCVDTLQIYPTMMSKLVTGLFFAGQINGTSGYEEAAAQGLMAGINAAAYIKDKEALILGRDQGYIGVLIDDLVTKGTEEPYRIFTARVEYRLTCRFDNADDRLADLGNKYELLSDDDFEIIKESRSRRDRAIQALKAFHVKQNPINPALKDCIGRSYEEVLRRPEYNIHMIQDSLISLQNLHLSEDDLSRVEIEIKYQGYIQKQHNQIQDMQKMEKISIPQDLDYTAIIGLSVECAQKLQRIKPITIGHASRISGVSPADLTVLIYHLRNKMGSC